MQPWTSPPRQQRGRKRRDENEEVRGWRRTRCRRNTRPELNRGADRYIGTLDGRPMSRDTEYTLRVGYFPPNCERFRVVPFSRATPHFGQRHTSVPLCTSVPTLRNIWSYLAQDYTSHTQIYKVRTSTHTVHALHKWVASAFAMETRSG